MSDRLSIAQFTPFPWDEGGEINTFVERVSSGLAERGHSVFIAAPSGSRQAVKAARTEIEALAGEPDRLHRPGDEPLVLSMGGVPVPRGSGKRPAPVSVDVGRRIERLLGAAKPDIVHVHDPFVPGFSSTALRHSFSLNVGTFHETAERPFATLVARPFLEVFFGRLDARTATSLSVAGLIDRFFPGSYLLTPPGVDHEPPARSGDGPFRIAFCDREEKGALRLFLRALRRLPDDLDWTATIYSDRPGELEFRSAKAIRERIRLIGPDQVSLADFLSSSDVFCAASNGPRPAPTVVRQALASGAIPVVTTIPDYLELADDGRRALLFPPGDPETLAGQLTRLAGDESLRDGMRLAAGSFEQPSWAEVTDLFEELYAALAERRQRHERNPALAREMAERPLIDVDLHMHTDHSSDCATPVEVLIETARDRGFGAIAITDHNEVSGALEAARLAEGMDDFQVIVGEEVKTAEQGEVIGLFLKEKIPKGLTMAETVAEIRRQGGLVYVPHPFDRLHSVPDYEHLLEIVGDVDLIEVFNPRVAITSFNEEAERFASKYGLIPAAGSDSHVAQGLGSVRVTVPRFEGPDEFLEAMRQAEITRRHKNLVYVQALKFLQTSGGSGGSRRSVPNARAARGGQPRRRRRRAGKS